MAGSLAPVMYWAVRTTLCSALRSAVEPFEDLRTHAKSFHLIDAVLAFMKRTVALLETLYRSEVCSS